MAQDLERRRVERDLHDGAQQRLVQLSLSLGAAVDGVQGDRAELEEVLRRASAELAAARQELRELARGIHPAVLSEVGLAAAVEALAERAPVPVEVHVPEGRWPHEVEAAAYFVVAEALTNVAKHARAGAARVSVVRRGGELELEVRDDGRGGAAVAGGTGLQGLRDRVAVLRGSLEVVSPPRGGTTVKVVIPCGSS